MSCNRKHDRFRNWVLITDKSKYRGALVINGLIQKIRIFVHEQRRIADRQAGLDKIIPQDLPQYPVRWWKFFFVYFTRDKEKNNRNSSKLYLHWGYLWSMLILIRKLKNNFRRVVDSFEDARLKVASLFWKIVISEWIGWNTLLVVGVSLYIGISVGFSAIPVAGLILGFINIALNVFLSFFSIAEMNFAGMAEIIAKDRHLADVKSWNDAVEELDGLRVDPVFDRAYRQVVEDLRIGSQGKGPIISQKEMDRLLDRNNHNPKAPQLFEAEEAIKLLINNFVIMKNSLKENPALKVETEEDIRRETVVVSGYGELYRETIKSLDDDKKAAGMPPGGLFKVISKWNQIMSKHGYEWKWFLEDVTPHLSPNVITQLVGITKAEEAVTILTAKGVANAKQLVEDWANWRCENSWKTIESIVYSHVASYRLKYLRFHPDATEEEIKAWMRGKVRFLIKYDTCFAYDPLDRSYKGVDANSKAIIEQINRHVTDGWDYVDWGDRCMDKDVMIMG